VRSLSLLGRLFFRRPPSAASGRPAFRPWLEGLEERTLLNSRFVVPVGAPVDNTTTFSTLSAALTRPGLVAGDVITIQRGSAPGAIGNADLPAVQHLTIQGDPTSAAVDLPAFQVKNLVTIDVSRAGFTLANVNVDLQGGGLTFDANGTIVRSFIASNFAGDAVTFNGVSGSVLRDSEVLAHNGISGGEIIRVNTVPGSSNLIENNLIASDATVSTNLLFYSGAATVSDQVVDNTFQGNVGASSFALLLVGAGVSGLNVHGNTFIDPNSNRTAITILSGGQNNTIADNTITLTGASGTIGISLLASSASATSVTIVDNRIDTSGNGTGIQLTTNAGALNARVEGNDFHFNAIGVLITRTHSTDPATGIDLGGGTQGSRGANNFRSFVPTSKPGVGAIVEAFSFSTAQTISARFNLFSVGNPKTVILDNRAVGGLAVVDSSTNLTGNAAFVETLYLRYLHRVGDLSISGDANAWVNALSNGTPRSMVVGAIMNSPEALAFVVGGLYRRFLDREPGSGEVSGYVAFLQQGGTVEQAVAAIVTSPEYQARFDTDAAFVQSLYGSVLNRTAGSAEVAAWVALLPQIGRAGLVIDLLGSAEYRAVVVQQDYATILGRQTPPSAVEVAAWVNSGLALRTIEALLASSAESFSNA
jgi:hypothetical protein